MREWPKWEMQDMNCPFCFFSLLDYTRDKKRAGNLPAVIKSCQLPLALLWSHWWPLQSSSRTAASPAPGLGCLLHILRCIHTLSSKAQLTSQWPWVGLLVPAFSGHFWWHQIAKPLCYINIIAWFEWEKTCLSCFCVWTNVRRPALLLNCSGLWWILPSLAKKNRNKTPHTELLPLETRPRLGEMTNQPHTKSTNQHVSLALTLPSPSPPQASTASWRWTNASRGRARTAPPAATRRPPSPAPARPASSAPSARRTWTSAPAAPACTERTAPTGPGGARGAAPESGRGVGGGQGGDREALCSLSPPLAGRAARS